MTLASGFDFARRQRDPRFREYLHRIGWTSEHHVVVAGDDEPVSAVVARIINNDTPSPCLIAIPHSGEPFGFGLMFLEVTHAATRRSRLWHRSRTKAPGGIVISPGTSIGMLYSSGRRCAEYIPNEWTRPVVFTHVPSAV
ncbi:hypothetical protein KIF24_07210 [Micromonospora sp. Llam7]|uniref:hypothetical protein n=1 Tax=Micromonospora tarapacensis TaxID=2835305 RepID=UPI001C838F71|nr:hypothetical protein [Micromonospora tarapacensis]MBX7265839.1 hypothetical protein [Micromonospora tarapacensis]